MKKIFSIILIILLYFNTIDVFAETQPKTLTQGIYTWNELGLPSGSPIAIKLGGSTNKAIVMVIDSDQTIEALVRLNNRIGQQTLPPLNYTSSIIIFTDGSVVFP